ncbi:hypothetical protein HSX37_07065|uniref:Flagellar basal-body rod modification protein FlgD n=1 Tax=Dendrosporobacter quercicolus TaxID=146817 RepID=A0A1G9VTH9_9FIRM|nr:flagellar hook capping FlgD N-terminal domain-containing protein [Dendrosporobacter quercicolus]NSL47804.1 hypothetical protein [Dendrosporobacter quercicolus DSM 1736]SDM75463.1 flagellar basal-body rod modification protein FlgD [Dendrosporobacter quercicolus]
MSTITTTTEYWSNPTTVDTGTTKSTSTIVDYDTFFSLLITELQNQDPTDPVSNTEYVSQLAQLASLGQLESVTTSINASQAYALIGKEVTYQTTDDSGKTATGSGTVDSVVISSGTAYLKIGSNMVKTDAVTEVK